MTKIIDPIYLFYLTSYYQYIKLNHRLCVITISSILFIWDYRNKDLILKLHLEKATILNIEEWVGNMEILSLILYIKYL